MAAFILIGAATNIAAEVLIVETYSYYTVTGSSAAELRQSINKERYKNTGLKGFDASTQWTISWTFDYLPTQTHCRITGATVTAKIEYRLPQWQGTDSSTNLTLIETWNTYNDSLRRHESEHGIITKKTAENIENNLLKNLPAHSNCQKLQTQANRIASQLVNESRKQHKDFDVATDHGGKTGAVFP